MTLYDPRNPIYGPRKVQDYSFLDQLEAMRRGGQRAPRQISSGTPRPNSASRTPPVDRRFNFSPGPRPTLRQYERPTFTGGQQRPASDTNWSYLDQLDKMRNRPMPGPRVSSRGAEVEEPEGGTIPMFGKSLADYLAGVDESQFSGEMLAELDAREQALRGQASAGDAELARIYQWLMNQIGGQDAQINQQYEQAQGQTRQNMQAATNALVQGGQSTDQQLAEAFGNLGIEPGAGSGNLAAGRAGQLGDMAQRGQINADYLANTGSTQRNLNRENRTAAGYRGAEERAAMQQQLARFLAELQGERTSVRAQGRSQAQQAAQAQYEADLQNFMAERDFATKRDDEAWNRELETARLQLSQQEAAGRNRPEPAEQMPFDQIATRLTQTQGRARTNQIMSIIAQQAQAPNNQNTTPGNFARRVHDAVAKLGLPPAAALEAHAAAEQYWQAYRD